VVGKHASRLYAGGLLNGILRMYTTSIKCQCQLVLKTCLPPCSCPLKPMPLAAGAAPPPPHPPTHSDGCMKGLGVSACLRSC
jgi:hypothetical protein